MQKIGNDIWLLTHELTALGVNVGRVVTLMRSPEGDLALHSTAAYTTDDCAAIRALGKPRWLFDAMADHDTFLDEGRRAFPECEYLGTPSILSGLDGQGTRLFPPPAEWAGWLEVLPIDGIPDFEEHVCLHKPSGTLVVCDLVINVIEAENAWESIALRLGTSGGIAPGVSRRLRHAIKDEGALRASLGKIMEWDFDRVVVGHRDPILVDGKRIIGELFAKVGLL